MKSFIFFLFVVLLASCSVEKNTLTSKTYHNLASHYNGYFYALEEITKIEQGYLKSMKDDYNRILRLYPKLDSAQSKTYEKELQEVIKMASIAIQRHQNSKWVDDSYILIGKARHYSLDWANAIQTFKYVNTNSKDDEARHEAILNLMRTFTEHQEYTSARAAGDYLQKAKLSDEHKKHLYLEKAYLAQTQNDLDGMVKNLTEAAPLLKKKADRPGRVYFVIGQVYQKLGFEAEAYNYYKKCLGTHPEYETDFYARLYMAQVTEISKNRNINAARKSFKRLLKDNKNRDFKDKIYYEMGVFELKQQNIEQGVENFNRAIRIGTNKQVDGEAYLRLGEMYYDSRDFELSQNYYDSAVVSLPADYENLEAIKKRQAILDEFVKHITTIRWQDSLLIMSQYDTATLRQKVETSVKATLKPETDKKKKRINRIEIEQAPTSIFVEGDPAESAEGGTWYFANPSAVALGQTEFARVWGSVTLEDNWRRSQRTQGRPQSAQTAELGTSLAQNQPAEKPKTDAVKEALEKIKAELPDTEEKKAEALKKIEEAYYHLGDIYSLKLEEPHNAVEVYEKLLTRFTQSEYTPEVLYRLHILTKERDPGKAQNFANRLKANYPESSWAKILINPDYLTEAGKATVRQKALYSIAYNKYTAGNYDSTSLVLQQARALGITTFTPNLTLLEILLVAKKDVNEYRSRLHLFMEEYKGTELSVYAKKLLDASSSLLDSKAQSEEKPLYTTKDESEHHFVIVYSPNPALEKIITEELAKFHKKTFPEKQFQVEQFKLTEEKALCRVAIFSNTNEALAYLNQFNEKLSTMAQLKTYNFNNFVIEKDNYETLHRTQALNEYLIFYKRYYQTENQ